MSGAEAAVAGKIYDILNELRESGSDGWRICKVLTFAYAMTAMASGLPPEAEGQLIELTGEWMRLAFTHRGELGSELEENW